jgi:acyl-CoA synthetase (NDP forming)
MQYRVSFYFFYHFPLALNQIVQSSNEAIQFFKKIKKPLTLKIESDEIVHKSEFDGVIINIDTEKQIKKSYNNLLKNVQKFKGKPKILGILVQETVKGDIELVFGMNRDPNYGPLIMFGMGGIFVETFKDVSFRISPVTDYDALEMIKEIKGYPILHGVRGKKGMDINYIVDIIQRLSQLSLDWPQISELDLNPFIMSADRDNCKIVDARIRINLSI